MTFPFERQRGIVLSMEKAASMMTASQKPKALRSAIEISTGYGVSSDG
jgi:hypothetical protein